MWTPNNHMVLENGRRRQKRGLNKQTKTKQNKDGSRTGSTLGGPVDPYLQQCLDRTVLRSPSLLAFSHPLVSLVPASATISSSALSPRSSQHCLFSVSYILRISHDLSDTSELGDCCVLPGQLAPVSLLHLPLSGATILI